MTKAKVVHLRKAEKLERIAANVEQWKRDQEHRAGRKERREAREAARKERISQTVMGAALVKAGLV